MKQTLRQAIKEKIKDIPSEKRQEYSFCITQKIIEKFGHLDNRHIYISTSDEVNTSMLISHLEEAEKKIYTPEMQIEEQAQIEIIIVP